MDEAPKETISQPAGRPRDGRRATMKQVAALAGVSLSTVSRVVNDDPAVRADLVAQVRQAVDVLGYRHNTAASALRRADGLSASIGLIVEDVANPFFSAVQRGIEEVARERGHFRRGANESTFLHLSPPPLVDPGVPQHQTTFSTFGTVPASIVAVKP